MGLDAVKFKELLQKFKPVIGENRFGMKLETHDGVLAMLDGHHDVLWCFGQHFEFIGQRVRGGDQGVVAADLHRAGKFCKNRTVGMFNQGDSTVHRFW